MRSKILNFSILIIILVLFSGCTKTVSQPINNLNQAPNQNTSGQGAKMNYSFPGVLAPDKILNKKAVIKTSKGEIAIDLYGDKAPKTVSNFVYLSEAGFYNNLTFHRVEPGFVIQGGDPSGNGTGGPGYKFPDEEVQGDYIKGAVAMANSGPDTNGSQFFICLDNLTGKLAKSYNLFGQVTSGMDVVSKIQVGDKIESITISNK